MVTNLSWPDSHLWNTPLILALFVDSSADAMLRLSPPREDRVDIWIWTKKESGIFSVKSMVREL